MLRTQHRTAALSLLLFSHCLNAANQNTETKDAWDAYLQVATAAMQARLQPGANFLWLDDELGRTEYVRKKGPYILC